MTMGYLFLAFALMAGLTKGYCGKRLGGFAANTQSAVMLNMIRMLLCIGFAFAVLLLNGDLASVSLSPTLILISALSGVGSSFFVVSWLMAVRKNAYMMIDVFLMLGTLVPMLLGYALFSEPITLRQWIGFTLLIVATLVMCSYNKAIKTKLTLPALLLLLACGAASGITDFSQKLFVKTFPQLPITVFNLYTYVFAALTLAIVFAIVARKEKPKFENSASRSRFLYVFIMAAALTANSQFKTMAAVHLDSAKLYPLTQGIALGLSTLMATVCFKEKFTRKAGLGITLAFAALLIMNL